ncbi:MAG: response regulator transcription factor [Burkholderiales bacterium]|nr:response regulator transcription factor [Burkholderiales bacterium]
MRILLIEDEPKIASFVCQGLRAAGMTVDPIEDGLAGLNAVLQAQHDLLVLDIMLPQLDGFELLRKARSAGITLPVIVLSAKTDLADRLQGFDLGADDYLAKPFFIEELIARIRSLLGRNASQNEDVFSLAGITLNRLTRRADWEDRSAVLSQREFMLLDYLMRSPGYIFSRKQILQHVWNFNFDPQTNVVDVCVQRIKKKLVSTDNSTSMFPIESIRGVGYRINLKGLA